MNIEKLLDQKKVLIEQDKKLREKFWLVDFKLKKHQHRLLAGKYFIYKRNSYSCPQDDDDYWNEFLRVRHIRGARIIVDTYSKDKDGKLSMEFRKTKYSLSHGWEEISKAKFNRAVNKILNEVKRQSK